MVSIYDIYLAIPLIVGTVRGFKRGFLPQLSALVLLLLSIYIITLFADATALLFLEHWQFNYFDVGAIVFTVGLLLFIFLIHVLVKYFYLKLRKTNTPPLVVQLLGGVVGLIRYSFIVSAFFAVFLYFAVPQNWINETAKENSILFEPAEIVAPFIYPFLEFQYGN